MFIPETIKNGVHYLTEKENSFSNDYIRVRDIEKRVLTDEQVKKLPFVSKNNQYYNEWIVRQKSTQRFISYLGSKNTSQEILDIGCGNGWFSNLLASVNLRNNIYGLDINAIELEQAARIFKAENLQFCYGDLFQSKKEFEASFNIITLNACVQYFQDFNELFEILKLYLKPKGEIHIIDSPFYNTNEIKNAQNRTIDYYTRIGVPTMSSHYYHHSLEDINNFEKLYIPSNKVVSKFFRKKDSPFMWLRYIAE